MEAGTGVGIGTAIIIALLAISEVLALTKLKSNSVFQLVFNILKTIAGKK